MSSSARTISAPPPRGRARGGRRDPRRRGTARCHRAPGRRRCTRRRRAGGRAEHDRRPAAGELGVGDRGVRAVDHHARLEAERAAEPFDRRRGVAVAQGREDRLIAHAPDDRRGRPWRLGRMGTASQRTPGSPARPEGMPGAFGASRGIRQGHLVQGGKQNEASYRCGGAGSPRRSSRRPARTRPMIAVQGACFVSRRAGPGHRVQLHARADRSRSGAARSAARSPTPPATSRRRSPRRSVNTVAPRTIAITATDNSAPANTVGHPVPRHRAGVQHERAAQRPPEAEDDVALLGLPGRNRDLRPLPLPRPDDEELPLRQADRGVRHARRPRAAHADALEPHPPRARGRCSSTSAGTTAAAGRAA